VYSILYIETSQFNDFLKSLRNRFQVFSPQPKTQTFTQENDYSYKRLSAESPFVFNPYRAVEPLKTFFTQAEEKMGRYFSGEDKVVDLQEKTIVFGVKSCDIAGHRIQDFVFLEGVEVDAVYRLRRENTILVSGDCTDYKSVCHCLAWDILPYPSWGFDLNISPLNDGYVVEAGSDKGEELLEAHKDLFLQVKDAQIAGRRAKRESLIDRLRRHLLPQGLVHKEDVQRLVKEGYFAGTWQEFMLTCVECGGCNFICDTCHCFLLSDIRGAQQHKKIRSWDSCQYANYARVAGGANPLKLRAQRLRFRFTKKFDFFVDNLGIPACCGCGRCIEGCPGKIDIREVLKDLGKKIKNKTA